MTTMTYTAAAPSFDTRDVLTKIKPIATKSLHILAVFFGANADRDTAFRGLDLNGNPMWVK